jgi:SOS-response transcriptional repressor LexA
MSWALPYIPKLQAGETVQFRPRGHSMTGRISSGQLVTVAPCTIEELRKGDIVLCKVQGTIYLHLVSAIGQDGRVQISNNHNHVNGWTKTVYGRCIAVED